MSHKHSRYIRLVVPVLSVASAFGVFAAWKHTSGSHHQAQQIAPRRFPPGDPAHFRNLSFQPEAGKLSRRLGRRFIDSDAELSVLIGKLTTSEGPFPIRLLRQQDKQGESVEITADGQVLAWNAVDGVKAEKQTRFDRSLIERITFDSADAFILAQLRGASYQVVGRNVRADLGGTDNYDGPLWTVVRVTEPDTELNNKPGSSSRLYYINSRTGLLDKVVAEVAGEQVEAVLDGWTSEGGETFPAIVRWTRDGRQIMALEVSSFVRPTTR